MTTTAPKPARVTIPSAPPNVVKLQSWLEANAAYVENLIGVPIDAFTLTYSKKEGIGIAFDPSAAVTAPAQPAAGTGTGTTPTPAT